jgi:hypothetical protein
MPQDGEMGKPNARNPGKPRMIGLQGHLNFPSPAFARGIFLKNNPSINNTTDYRIPF